MTPPELVDPTFGGYNSTRYDITSPEGANRYDPNLTTSVRHYDMISDFARLVNNYKRSDAVYFVKNAIKYPMEGKGRAYGFFNKNTFFELLGRWVKRGPS